MEAFGLDPGIIDILKDKYGPELLPIQEKAFKDHRVLSGGNFIIFAVTSAGKTLVGEILSLFNAARGRRVFYLVPTKALAEEKKPVELPPTTFRLMVLLAKRPGEVITREEIYTQLWPEFISAGDSPSPYDRQISDHKRKITTGIKRAIKGKKGLETARVKDLIKTRRKVGYMLDIDPGDVYLFG